MRIIVKVLPWIILGASALVLWKAVPRWLFGDNNDGVVEVINHNTILKSIEALGKLELVRYNFKEVTELTEKNKAYLGVFRVPDSKAILITNGEAVGCIDLTRLKEDAVRIQQDTIYLNLPEPELCYYKLDLKNSRIYSVEKVVYYKDDKQLIEKAYRLAEDQIKLAALKSGILEQTTQNAEIMLKPMLEQISGKKVVFMNRLNQNVVIDRR